MRNLLALLLILTSVACVPDSAPNEDAEANGELARLENLRRVAVEVRSRTNCSDPIALPGLAVRVTFPNGARTTYETDQSGRFEFMAEPRTKVSISVPGFEDSQLMSQPFPTGPGCYRNASDLWVTPSWYDEEGAQPHSIVIVEEDPEYKNSTYESCGNGGQFYSRSACG